MDQVMPASAVTDVVFGQQVQPAEQAPQPAEGPPAAVRPGARHVPGDQDPLSLMYEDRLPSRASLGGELLLLEAPEHGRVSLNGRPGPVCREDPGDPVRAVPAADAIYAEIELGQLGHRYPVARFQLGGQCA